MTRVTLVTFKGRPHGEEDDQLLANALKDAGADARFAAWDDPNVDWSSSDVTIIRSTWNYHLTPKAWFIWLASTAKCTRLVNQLELVSWNSEKTYLLDLAAADVPVVPTEVLDLNTNVAEMCAARQWTDVVIKPTIGASAYGAKRFKNTDEIRTDGQSHAAVLTAQGKALLQPYQASVKVERERSLVYVKGMYCHAFSKPDFDAESGPKRLLRHEATTAELAVAERIFKILPQQPVFARIDVVPSSSGPLVMEVELVEPALSFIHEPATAVKLAQALLRLATVEPEA